MKMFGECHAHIFLNGYDYRKAVETQKNGPRDALIRAHLEEYRKRGIRFVRDGGDHYGVSKRAARLAPEYEIDYRTPVFAIYKEGHYGKIVGKSFSDMKEYHRRVLEAAAEGADFIKIMTTGLLDFADHGKITGTPLSATDVKEMVHIAHEEGFAVMSHTNGCYGVQAAVEAGVDSIEHGNYMDDETISMLADSESVWVPTLVTVRNLKGCGRFEDTILASIIKTGEQNLKKAFEKKVHVAVGSDAGAYQVLHGQGVQDESRAFFDILGDTQAIRSWMEDGYTPGSKDVLSELRKNIFADPESADFQKQLKEVADFWESNFQYGEPNVQPDKNNSNEWIKIGWRSNYYIMGLSKDILDNNSWLGQTKGWTDQNGAAGTIDWQDDETLTID